MNIQFYDGQYGFRVGHSTELALIELIDRMTQDLDKGKIPISIFLDLLKALGTLDHVILLQKLSYYGIKSVELKLFKDYLQNRTNMFLLTIYINDLCNASTLVVVNHCFTSLFDTRGILGYIVIQ